MFAKMRWLYAAGILLLLCACASSADSEAAERRTVMTEHDDDADRINADFQGTDIQGQEETAGMDGEDHATPIEYAFPESASLTFRPVELTEMEAMTPAATWELVNSFSLGRIDDESVSLKVYRETDSEARCAANYESVGLLEHRGETYNVPDCLMNSLMDTDPDTRGELVVWEERHVNGAEEFILQGAAALSANGPGRMGYFYYDVLKGRWCIFEDWGKPLIADLDGDGSRELVIQFEGLHLSWPDVDIYRWREGVLEESSSVKEQLRIPDPTYNEAIMREQDGRYVIDIQVMLDPDSSEAQSAVYEYREESLFKLN